MLRFPILMAALAGASVASAQPVAIPTVPSPAPPTTSDPSIDSILQGVSAGTTDEEDAPEVTAPPEPSIVQPPVSSPPQDLAPAAPSPSVVEGRPPPPPRRTAEQYDAAVRATAARAQALQGPLDGGWTLAAPDGQPLYRFQIVDRGLGSSLAEAAWRDLRGASGAKGSGFVTLLSFSGSQLMVRFNEAGPEDLVVVSLKSDGAGGWSGELWRRGAIEQVVLRRD